MKTKSLISFVLFLFLTNCSKKESNTFETDYSKDRLKTLQGFSQKELELIKNSKYSGIVKTALLCSSNFANAVNK